MSGSLRMSDGHNLPFITSWPMLNIGIMVRVSTQMIWAKSRKSNAIMEESSIKE